MTYLGSSRGREITVDCKAHTEVCLWVVKATEVRNGGVRHSE